MADPELPPAAVAWRDSGRIATIAGRRLFVRRRPGDGSVAGAPTLLFLHGFPTSSFDWRATIDRLPGHDALTFDFLGFGLSEKPRGHDNDLFEQADLTEAVLAAEGVEGPVTVIAHDMGTTVANELIAREIEGRLPFALAGVLLSNGSVVVERASLRPIQKLLRSPLGPLVARLSNRRMFGRQMAALFSPGHPLDDAEAAAQWAQVARAGGHRNMHQLATYNGQRIAFAQRWHGALRDWDGRLGLAWGLLDPVATTAVLDALRALRPAAAVTTFDDLGHYPQVEDPARVAEAVAAFAAAG
ncbi:putative hydrolase or acyltransferase (alpha/beta hydrolase superfamily) [Patulibacter medicamentivorans]|uniref:Putative hydrolase or acyltransferase (Alpha/beta hydrolase superfamily) n=1 Tax=Patulibacter medicamentivorans TaxID=1097667 RepID=H0E4P0_9ACTN|nr:alpha/beta fold hydrolase [Patulibacter medicamentivorans]EHN11353.1 putative hydrolase or acyltransferase (alpha/beta hydrolase superfamily) [Patulibacter medicamentivorans]